MLCLKCKLFHFQDILLLLNFDTECIKLKLYWKKVFGWALDDSTSHRLRVKIHKGLQDKSDVSLNLQGRKEREKNRFLEISTICVIL